MTSKIDRLGLLQAQAAPLLTKIETLKDEIAAELGVGSHEGQWYRVSVVDAVRSTLPIKVARAKLKALGVAARWFRDHTVYTPYTSVTCEARTGHNIKAFTTRPRFHVVTGRGVKAGSRVIEGRGVKAA